MYFKTKMILRRNTNKNILWGKKKQEKPHQNDSNALSEIPLETKEPKDMAKQRSTPSRKPRISPWAVLRKAKTLHSDFSEQGM